jgi:hypothetical protein
MFIQSKMILSVAIVLGSVAGTVCLAQAGMGGGGGYDYESYGGPTQTWCDIDPNCNGWNRGLRPSPFVAPNAISARAAVVVPSHKHRPARKQGHDVDNH